MNQTIAVLWRKRHKPFLQKSCLAHLHTGSDDLFSPDPLMDVDCEPFWIKPIPVRLTARYVRD